jgi:integrase
MKKPGKQDFRLQTLKLLEGLNRVVSSQAGDLPHAPFSLHPRPTTKKQGGRVVNRYYVQFWDAERRCYGTARSTGQTSESAAFAWAMAQLGADKEKRENTNWATLAKGMFDQGSDFLKFYQPLKKSFGEIHRRHCQNYLEEYLLPLIGKDLVAKTDSRYLQNLQSQLLLRKIVVRTKATVGDRQQRDRAKAKALGLVKTDKTLSPNTVGKIMAVMRLMIKWAFQQGDLKHDPFLGFIPASPKTQQRGVLERDELRRLFQLGPEAWPDKRLRVFCLVAATSGLRSGELQGLLRECVQEIQDSQGRACGLLEVRYSWSQTGELKLPKNGKPRRTTVPHAVYLELQDLMKDSPYKGPRDYVFYQAKQSLPVSAQMISEHFARALRALGISDEERKARGLTFHSFRHGTNSHLVEAGIPLLRIQALIGHNSTGMTANYYHERRELEDILEAQAGILGEDGTA